MTWVYGLAPPRNVWMASWVARSTSLPENGCRTRRSDAAMSTAYAPTQPPGRRRVRLTARSATPTRSSAKRSACGVSMSMPATHQRRPARIAASLARERTELAKVILQRLELLTVGREVAAPERRLGLRVMVRCALDELCDRGAGARWHARWWWWRRHGWRRCAEQRIEALGERLLHHDLVLRREDHPLELWELALRGLDEERFDVQEGVADGQHDEVAADHLGPAPDREERQLLTDRRIGLDARLDLERPEDRAALGESQDAQLAVVRWVGATGDPRHHVVALRPGRRHRDEQDELALARSGQLCGDVVRLDRLGLPALRVDLVRDAPGVVPVVEVVWIGHVVDRVDLGLDVEELLGVPQVGLQARRHLRDRREELRIDVAERAEDRVLLIDDVVGDRSVVRVGHDLHAVPDVVEIGQVQLRRPPAGAVPLAVRVARAGRVRVVDPVELAVDDDEVRIGVVAEERRDQGFALADLAVEQDTAVTLQLLRDEHVEVTEADREQDAVPEAGDRYAAAAAEARRRVVLLLRVVELVLARAHDHVIARELAVIDPRLVDLRLADRRDVLQHELRPALDADAADRGHDRAESMRVVEVAVHPGLRRLRQLARRELAGREHDRGLVAVDDVAVDVDVVERVVLTEGLALLVGREQRPVVPEPDGGGVAELAADLGRIGIVGDVHLRLLDVRERVRLPGRLDVAVDVRPLLVQLIRADSERLDQGRVHAADEDGRDEPQAERGAEDPQRPEERVRERGERREGDDDREED